MMVMIVIVMRQGQVMMKQARVMAMQERSEVRATVMKQNKWTNEEGMVIVVRQEDLIIVKERQVIMTITSVAVWYDQKIRMIEEILTRIQNQIAVLMQTWS